MKLTLLSRAYCHLCDEMLAEVEPMARARGAIIDVIDVDAPAHEALETEWGDRVPALFAGEPGTGILLCHFRLHRERLLQALGPASARPD